jgi:transcriptional regulator with GAF, ATPase, and Fis domain
VDVRIVCAANVQLEKEVEAGRFRADLYYRINVITLHLPPLRDRLDDVGLLARSFVEELAKKLGRRPPVLSDEVAAALRSYTWPGNVRELRNVIERAILLARGDEVGLDLLPFTNGAAQTTERKKGDTPALGATLDLGPDLDLKGTLRRAERQTLQAALAQADGVRRQAARLLGIDERNLAYYLRKHDLMEPARGDEGNAES